VKLPSSQDGRHNKRELHTTTRRHANTPPKRASAAKHASSTIFKMALPYLVKSTLRRNIRIEGLTGEFHNLSSYSSTETPIISRGDEITTNKNNFIAMFCTLKNKLNKKQ